MDHEVGQPYKTLFLCFRKQRVSNHGLIADNVLRKTNLHLFEKTKSVCMLYAV